MKIHIPLIIALLTYQIFAQQSSISLATMLETKISVEVNSASLAGALKNLRAEINDEIPEFKSTNIVCDELNRTSVAEFKKSQQLKFVKSSLRDVLRLIGVAYSCEFRFDLNKSEILFTPASGGEDPKRWYKFDKDLSDKLLLDWGKRESIGAFFERNGVVANVSEIVPENRSVCLSGSVENLNFADMVILVRSRTLQKQ